MNVDPMRVIDKLKTRMADLMAESALLSAGVEQLEQELATARAELEKLRQSPAPGGRPAPK
jgi:hypothetical protein